VARSLDAVADELYAAPPEEFVASRERAVERARKERDTQGAGQLSKLRKPTVAAWLVNLLALRQPELVDELVELSRELRQAQRELRGDQLRELSGRRRSAVAALVAQARALAVAERPELAGAKLPLAEVEGTLTAALSDEEVAVQVRSGRLIRAVAYAGFGEVPRPRLRLVTGGEQAETAAAPAKRPGPAKDAGDEARRAREAKEARAERDRQRVALRKELAIARSEAKKAEAASERAAAAERDGADDLAAIEAQLAELERRKAAAEEELGRRRVARKVAERQAVAARRRAGEVEGALESFDKSDA
jgi:hypothetical protein